MHSPERTRDTFNEIFEKYGLSPEMRIGSNSAGNHPASIHRPVQNAEWDKPGVGGYTVGHHMINEPPERPFRIILIGAGAAGIDFLHHAPSALEGLNVSITCYDKNADIGGTWYENRYPGCACDVPSVGYTFPWRANPDWTNFYSGSREIWEYFKQIVEEEGMGKYIQLDTKVVKAVWDEDVSHWKVTLSRSTTPDDKLSLLEWEEECDLLLNGTGFLNAWKWPNIPGIHSFKGDLFHTAHYKEGYNLRNKRVAVIGSGSSGVQAVASIYPEVSQLYTWIRNPTWITAAFGQQFAGKNGENFSYTQEQKDEWRNDPEKYQRYKKMIENELNKRFKLVLRNTRESDEANAFAFKDMSTKLSSKPNILDAIIPKDFNVACRRPTPGNGYLEALAGEKTTVLTGEIGSITATGIVDATTGIEYPIDVIICATGFDTSYRPRFPILGLGGQDLSKKWATYPASYLGIGVDGWPNYFMYSGPFTPVAQGSILPILSMLTQHFLSIIKRMRKQHIRRLSPKASAVQDFVVHANTFLQRTCWADPCPSWFKQGRKTDTPIIMWPGSRLSFFDVLREPYFDDYEIEFWSGNRWGWLGNGFSTIEFDGKSDITYYLDEYSDREQWKTGVPFNLDPHEFDGVAQGRVPVESVKTEVNGDAAKCYTVANGVKEEADGLGLTVNPVSGY